jgi:6-phosphogluconolactonase (cycloisomerase 2 family)
MPAATRRRRAAPSRVPSAYGLRLRRQRAGFHGRDLPPDRFGASTAAAIGVTAGAGHVLVSNRWRDGIAQFEFDAAPGWLKSVGWQPTDGWDPWFVTLDPTGDRLRVANEQGDSIVAFDIAEPDGLGSRGRVLRRASPRPIAFLRGAVL